MPIVRIFAVVIAILSAAPVFAQTPPALARAIQWVEKNPSIERRVGLAEMQRAHGLRQAGLDELQETLTKNPANDPRAIELHELVCWRMLPVGAAQRETFRKHVARLKAMQPGNRWVPVWELYLVTSEPNRAAIVAAVAKTPAAVPERFPGSLAEAAHLAILKELGESRVQAGVEVITARTYEPLHALRDLDRALTREADFLRDSQRGDDATQVLAVRDRYRHAYGRASRHLVEKLFALHLAGATKERDALLVKAKSLPYLHERQRLAGLLQRLDDEPAWTLLIEPLLANELALIENPPNLAKLQTRNVAELQIKGNKKTVQDQTIRYEGNAHFRLHAIEISCAQLTLLQNADPGAVVLTGSDNVHLRGVPGYPDGITADRFSFHAETGVFSLGGDVRLRSHDKTMKLRACTLTQRGELRDSRSWLDDFHACFTPDARLELLPKITKVYEDAELPDEVRYLLALNLLRPHLTWHAPYLPPLADRREWEDRVQRKEWRDHDTPWQEALGGESWMLADISPAIEKAFRDSLFAWHKKRDDASKDALANRPSIPIPEKDLCFWRIRDPQHRDITRATQLLQGIRSENLYAKAHRWSEEIRRNNTVLTFDIAGAAPLGRTHSVLMDVRNAESVSFKLFRVARPEQLVYAARNIGRDFIFRDHHLDDRSLFKRIDTLEAKNRMGRTSKELRKETVVTPAWKKEQLVHEWSVHVADLRHHPSERERRYSRRWHDAPWQGEADAHYFDDECSEHRQRLDKNYRPRDGRFGLSSWQCDRVVEIPEKLLADAGAYVLIAESNGQAAHVPIVVEPLSLTLRRCRDGVFTMVSDAEGKTPLAGATVYPKESDGEAITDKEGVAFARIFAHGDQPIIAHHQGRYAIGGFGEVFEGIYHSPYHDWRDGLAFERLQRARRGEGKDVAAHRYRDQHVVVAYTDRPTYRPGQEVNFKMILRKLQPEKGGNDVSAGFRATDFDAKTKMVLPDLNDIVAYTVHDPKGHEVGHGALQLGEFGTVAGKLALNAESVVGAYTFRVHIAGQPRIVPEVFAVKHYRRPNFEVVVTGVPETLTKPAPLALTISSQYYFGPPVSKGTIEVRVFRKNFGNAILVQHGQLDEKGKTKIELRLPRSLDAGKYHVVCSITDDSGRSVSTTKTLTIATPDAPPEASGLSKLPRFIAVNQEVKLATSAKEISAQQDLTDLRFPAKGGAAVLKFAKPGWYHLRASDRREREGDDDAATLFVYGGQDHPLDFANRDHPSDGLDPRAAPRWVNLSDFAHQEDRYHVSRWENRDQHLFALFDQQTLKAGESLRLLVYVPRPGSRLLFTIEGRTILDYAVVRSKADGGVFQIVEIPIKDRYFPNVYVQGRILGQVEDRVHEAKKAVDLPKLGKKADLENNDEDLDPRWCRVDVVKPAGKIEAGALNVQIETDQATYRPRDTVRAIVKVTDRDGRPQAAELSLAAIDESIFAFGEDNLDSLANFFRAPHEARHFQPKVWRTSIGSRWSRRTADEAKGLDQMVRDMAKMAEAMKQDQSMAKGDLAAQESSVQQFTLAPLPRLGGEMPAEEWPLTKLREHFQETAVWRPQIVTDKSGTANVSFPLPDSLTRYRLSSVALTKATEVGVGRARITVGLPVAVQVFLPRFAVEKDRVLAVGLIHNNTSHEHDCDIAWKLEGVGVDVPSPAPLDWKLVNEKGKLIGTGRVKVAANSSAKVGMWLTLDQIGTARIALRAVAGKESDAEIRTLPVQPLGRPAEINANEELAAVPMKAPDAKEIAGTFHREGRIQLPAGFLARELDISLATSDLAQALDGLDYLVEYPHGCIEQTMSRFMPAVMVKHATLQAPIKLHPEVAAKLPDILKQGLTRLYGHQHADGSWGWFEKDSRNFAMSVYVVYGLARCKATATMVDAQVLRHGCDYLAEELRTNTHEPELAARAWYALALAGHADTKGLAAWAAQEVKTVQHYRPVVWCNLALACRAAGLSELGEQLWAKKNAGWWGHDTETFALVLNTQLAFGSPYHECRTSATRLLSKRSGTRWAHTRDTSWAIEALANMLAYVPEKRTVGKIEVTLAGKTILEVKDAADLKKMHFRVRLSAEQLPLQEGLEIRMKSDSNEAIHVAVRAVGVQRQDEVQASGKRVQLQRIIESLEGEPVSGSLKIGQVVRVRLRLHLEQRENFLMIEERRASLCEFAHDRIAGSSAQASVHQEFRDDRLCVYFASLSAGTHEVVYYLRAETPGQCSILPGCAYPMYDEKHRGETASSKLAVK